jgi:integrase
MTTSNEKEVNVVVPTAVLSHENKRRNRRSARSDCHWRLKGLIAQHGHWGADGTGHVSFATSRARAFILFQGFEHLDSIGMCPRKPQNLKPKHVRKLVRYWEEQGHSPSTLQQRFSVFVIFCVWIGKKGMLGDIEQYLENPDAAKRIYVAKEDQSWESKGVNASQKTKEVAKFDERAAIVLKLMRAFGLRLREAVTLHAVEADKGTCLDVAWGTKGGRRRIVPIVNELQREVLEEAKQHVNKSTGSLIPDTYKRDTWIKHCYAVFHKCGISRKHGITPHGLRHQRANDLYEEDSGLESPVRGGTEPDDKQVDDHARQVVAETLGHSRKQSSSAYLGSFLKMKKKRSK